MRLATVALAGALAVPDVVRADAGAGVPGLTADGPVVLRGVSASAQSDGRYAIDLRLIARLVPLWPLAEEVRAAVLKAASRAGLAGSLGSVDIEFLDVLSKDELERPSPNIAPPPPPAAPPTPAAVAPPPPATAPPVLPAAPPAPPEAGQAPPGGPDLPGGAA